MQDEFGVPWRLSVESITLRDAIVMSAIILAIALLDRKCKQNKWIRRIVVVTDGRNPMDTADIEHIVKEIQNQGIQIVIL